MGPVANLNGRGEEEEENLSAFKTLRYIFDSFAKQPLRESTSGGQQKGH